MKKKKFNKQITKRECEQAIFNFFFFIWNGRLNAAHTRWTMESQLFQFLFSCVICCANIAKINV